ncbi:MAG: NUDIX pyrophosphatase [Clostridia bacterium]|nr:NUDIX pyrophosphatase [Clostridia bacterium]
MARAKYQVLVIPYRKTEDGVRYCIFKRSDMDSCWQFVAGGGEEEDATPLVSARREAFEEAGIPADASFARLETVSSISTEHFPKARLHWGEHCLVIPEYSFAAALTGQAVILSDEHTNFEWVDYDTAIQRLRYDSNRVALWELDNRIKLGTL